MADIPLRHILADPTHLATSLAGEDLTNEVMKVTEECNITVVPVADNVTTVSATPALLMGVYVNTVLSAHACPIKDGATTKLTLPSGMAAGTKIDCHGAIFATSLVVDPHDDATGEVLIFWRTRD